MTETSTNGRLAFLAPNPEDAFVLMMMNGRIVTVFDARDFLRALDIAHGFAAKAATVPPYTIKLISLTANEFLTLMGGNMYVPDSHAQTQSFRRAVVAASFAELQKFPSPPAPWHC